MLLSWGKYRLWIPYSLTSGIRLFDNRDKLTNATESEAYSLVSGIHLLRDIPTSLSDKRVAAVLTHELGSIDIYSNSWEPLNEGWKIQGLGPLISTALEKGIKEVLNNIIPFGLLNISSFIHNLPSFIAFLFLLPLLYPYHFYYNYARLHRRWQYQTPSLWPLSSFPLTFLLRERSERDRLRSTICEGRTKALSWFPSVNTSRWTAFAFGPYFRFLSKVFAKNDGLLHIVYFRLNEFLACK